MPSLESLLSALALTIVGAPIALVVVFLATFLLGRKLGEAVIGHLVQGTVAVSLLAAITPAERIGIILISLIVFLGGWFSPAVVESRHRIAKELLGKPTGPPAAIPAHPSR